jgi:hypothetical protein
MNTETEIPASPENGQASNIQSVDFSSEAKKVHRKIAKLPKPLRDLINSSLDDGLPAREIIQKLQASSDPLLPYTITEVDISRWKSTGYQRYLAQQDHLDSIEASREAALEMVRTNNNLSLPQATLQVIASQCFEILGDFSPAAVKQKLAEDPLKYTSFLHVFARLTREIVHLEKFQEARAAAQAQKSDPNRDPKAAAAEFWTRHTNNLFNRKDPDRAKIDNPIAIPLQSPVDPSANPKEIALQSPVEPSDNPKGIASFSPGLRGTSYPGFETPNVHNPERVAPSACEPSVSPPAIENQNSKIEILEEHCLDCHHPLPPLTPEGKRPHERCQVCNILLPPPGTCTRPSADQCHHCGATLPRRLPSGRRPIYVCHNCGTHLGRELEEDIKKHAQE